MTADDLERRAITAAHDAECMNRENCLFVSKDEYPKLNQREQAIVEAWRADVGACICAPHPFGDGPQPDCPVHGAIRAYNEAVKRVERVRTLADVSSWHVYESQDTGDVYPADSVRDLLTDIRAALDGEEADDGTR